MFYLEDDNKYEEEEEEVHEDSLSKTEGVYHGKAPAGILVSYMPQCPVAFACLLNLGSTERRGLIPFLRKM